MATKATKMAVRPDKGSRWSSCWLPARRRALAWRSPPRAELRIYTPARGWRSETVIMMRVDQKQAKQIPVPEQCIVSRGLGESELGETTTMGFVLHCSVSVQHLTIRARCFQLMYCPKIKILYRVTRIGGNLGRMMRALVPSRRRSSTWTPSLGNPRPPDPPRLAWGA